MEKTIAVRLPDVTKLDQLELRKQLSADDLHFESDSEGRDVHGELLTTTAVVLVSLSALRVLAAYLLKKTNRRRFRQRVEIVAADGTKHIKTIEYAGESSEAPEADILKQLAAACQVDLSKFPDA